MIVQSPLINEAILSNQIGAVTEFKIRSTAKSFAILSSGLYANKIRAIIRELSCNAVDSHVAAGKGDVPFSIHLPNSFEPWFAIRDYGVGLDHEQVVNIYTTYFESTKTESNDFIGALGLGSKSPFSYTNNFSVTAIKSNVKRIYAAFINDVGVPSTALMTTEPTDEPNGVEVRFSVTDSYDFGKFYSEAREVFKYFTLRPTVTGYNDFKFVNQNYQTKDIIPGVHQYVDSNNSKAIAVMGNICYPIAIPSANAVLGSLAGLLNCPLEMHFKLGELDFQASREGLSYIPATVEVIRRRLEELSAKVEDYLEEQLNRYDNLWDKIQYLQIKSGDLVFTSAVDAYCLRVKFPLYNASKGYKINLFNPVSFSVSDIETQYNIKLSMFTMNATRASGSEMVHPNMEYDNAAKIHRTVHNFYLIRNYTFVISDCKTRQLNRARKHYANHSAGIKTVVLLEPADKNMPAKYDEFLAALHNPKTCVKSSSLDRIVKEKREQINYRLLTPSSTRHRRRSHNDRWTWEPISSDFKFTDPVGYVLLKNKTPQLEESGFEIADLAAYLGGCGIPALSSLRIVGIRRDEIDAVKDRANWFPLEQYIRDQLKLLPQETIEQLAFEVLDNNGTIRYNNVLVNALPDSSEYKKIMSKFAAKVKNTNIYLSYFNILTKKYCPDRSVDAVVKNLEAEVDKIKTKYPLVQYVTGYNVPVAALAQYINLIDKHGETNE